MEIITHHLHDLLYTLTSFVTVIIELWGLFIVITAIVKEVYRVIFEYKLDFKKINADNNLNAGLASALEVLLVAEVLKTLTIDNYRNLIIIGVLILLRMGITLLLIWESTHKMHVDRTDKH